MGGGIACLRIEESTIVHADEVARHLVNHTAVKLTVAMLIADQEVDIIFAADDELIGKDTHASISGHVQSLLNL